MAVLARIAIPHQDVLPGKSSGLMRNAPVFEQPNNGRHVKRAPRRVDLSRGNFFRRGDTFQYQTPVLGAPRRC